MDGRTTSGIRGAAMIAAAVLVVVGIFSVTPGGAVPAEGDGADDVGRFRGWTVASFKVTGLDAALARDLSSGLVLNGKRGLLRTRRPPLFAATSGTT